MTATTPTGSTADESGELVQIFEPNTAELPDLRHYFHELIIRRTFIVELAKAEVRGPRSSTVMGELWALLDPIFQASIYWFMYVVIRGGASTGFLSVLVFGFFMFNYTRIAISDGGRAILKGTGLMLNSTFPRALLPISAVYQGILATVPAIAVYVVIHLLLGAPIGPGITVLPLLFLLQTTMNVGLALLLSTATVFIKDMSNLLNYIVRILTFMTPVIYPVSQLTPQLRAVLSWNPLFPLFASYQSVVTGQMPSVGLVFQAFVWSIVFLLVGASVFLRHERSLALHL